jgi:methylated-DNA-protein-cysteine methyltransferase-like protein
MAGRASKSGASTSFRARVLAVVRRIPRGRVATYGDVAELAGFPRAARAVGTVMRTCSDPSVPCHRVTGAAGALGGFGQSPQLKRDRLRAEGVTVVERRIRKFAGVRWHGGRS